MATRTQWRAAAGSVPRGPSGARQAVGGGAAAPRAQRRRAGQRLRRRARGRRPAPSSPSSVTAGRRACSSTSRRTTSTSPRSRCSRRRSRTGRARSSSPRTTAACATRCASTGGSTCDGATLAPRRPLTPGRPFDSGAAPLRRSAPITAAVLAVVALGATSASAQTSGPALRVHAIFSGGQRTNFHAGQVLMLDVRNAGGRRVSQVCWSPAPISRPACSASRLAAPQASPNTVTATLDDGTTLRRTFIAHRAATRVGGRLAVPATITCADVTLFGNYDRRRQRSLDPPRDGPPWRARRAVQPHRPRQDLHVGLRHQRGRVRQRALRRRVRRRRAQKCGRPARAVADGATIPRLSGAAGCTPVDRPVRHALER